jgi:hypothetical protein
MIEKAVKVPDELICAPFHHRDIKLNGLSIVESCTVTHRSCGSMFLEDHMLMVVLEGTNTITHGNMKYVLSKNEMIVLKKAIQINYDKVGNPEKGASYNSLMFFLKDEFLRDFVKMAKIESVETAEPAMVAVKPVKERLLKFFESVVPYFEDPENIDGSLMRLKMLELLYDLVHSDKNMLQQLLQLKQQVHGDIRTVVMDIMPRRFLLPNWPTYRAGAFPVLSATFFPFTRLPPPNGSAKSVWPKPGRCLRQIWR